MAVIRESRLVLPNDISIIGFDGIAQASFVSPPPATVAQPTEDMGKVATDLFSQSLPGPTSRPNQRVIVDVNLISLGPSGLRRENDD